MQIIKQAIKKIKYSKEMVNASWLIIGRVVQMLISFFISIITARYLGPNNYGLINYAAAFVAFFTSICTLGLNAVIIKDFTLTPEDQGKTLGTVLILRLLASFLSLIFIAILENVIDYNEKITIAVTLLYSLSLFFQAFDTFNYWFQFKYKSKMTALATLIAYFLTSCYKVLLFVLNKNVKWFAFASSFDYICLAIILVALYQKCQGPKLSFSLKKGKILLSQSYHYILSGMMVAIYGQTDKLMLKKMLDETSVGYYSLATSINSMWVFVLQAIIDSMYPTIVNCYKENKILFEKKNKQLYAIVIYMSIFVSLVFILFGGFAIKVVYGMEYEPAASSLNIITWYTVFSYLGVARNAWIVCENKQKYLKYMYLGAAVLNVILNYIMIPKWGAAGAALASLITQIATSVLLPSLIKDMRPNVKLMLEAFMLKNIK